jgi:hypothetical protein
MIQAAMYVCILLCSILISIMDGDLVAQTFSHTETGASDFEYIDTSFENASPLYWEIDPNGQIQIFLHYDHERASTNRAAGHWHFRIEAKKGSQQTIILNNLLNVYDGRKASPARESSISVISSDGLHWRALPMKLLEEGRVQVTIPMEESSMYVARIEPYDLSDLERFYTNIRGNALVKIITIGNTVEGRPLEIVRVGNPNAPYRVLLRARAHPWEPGGNWVVEGVVRRLLQGDAVSKEYLERYCMYILPITNKDGVARGLTRFNLRGMDLNRGWDTPADPDLAPERYALENWLHGMIDAGKRPDFAIDFHNDGIGKVHLSRLGPDNTAYVSFLQQYVTLLQELTWFTEGRVIRDLMRSSAFDKEVEERAGGFLARFGIPSCAHELNADWIAGVSDYPSAQHWESFGEQLCEVFYQLFEQ